MANNYLVGTGTVHSVMHIIYERTTMVFDIVTGYSFELFMTNAELIIKCGKTKFSETYFFYALILVII